MAGNATRIFSSVTQKEHEAFCSATLLNLWQRSAQRVPAAEGVPCAAAWQADRQLACAQLSPAQHALLKF